MDIDELEQDIWKHIASLVDDLSKEEYMELLYQLAGSATILAEAVAEEIARQDDED